MIRRRSSSPDCLLCRSKIFKPASSAGQASRREKERGPRVTDNVALSSHFTETFAHAATQSGAALASGYARRVKQNIMVTECGETGNRGDQARSVLSRFPLLEPSKATCVSIYTNVYRICRKRWEISAIKFSASCSYTSVVGSSLCRWRLQSDFVYPYLERMAMKFESLHTSIHLGIDTKCVCTYTVCKPSSKLQRAPSFHRAD